MSNKIYIVKSGDTLNKIASKLNISLDKLLDSNPKLKTNPNKITVGQSIIIPNNQIININNQEKSNSNKSLLGSLSAKYEVGNRDASTVSTGIGDAGGASYGSYQMTSKPNGGTVARFVSQLKSAFKDLFNGLVPGSQQFTNVWKELYRSNPEEFYNLQHDFIKLTHYDILINKIKNTKGIDLSTRSIALQNVLWSTAVQHGGNNSIVNKALDNLNLKLDDPNFDRELIKAIYAERGRKDSKGNLVYFGRNSRKVQEGVANRFINEQRDALKMLDSEL